MTIIETTVAESCRSKIANMILMGEILPGQKLHQSWIAQQFNVSRIPVREALSALEAEGIVTGKANTGYTVNRFEVSELVEIYLMRRLLETELLRATDPADIDLELIESLNKELCNTSFELERERFDELNWQFHWAIFDVSPLHIVRDEIRRLWNRTRFYRSFAWRDQEASRRICSDHERIIEAVRAQDIDLLIAESDSHRKSTEDRLKQRLGFS